MANNEEVKRELFNFAFAVYRVTDLLRPDEPMRKQLREHAGEILSRAVRCREPSRNGGISEYASISAMLEAARSLIELSRQTGLMKAINADILIRECRALEIYFSEEQAVLYKNELVSKRHEIQNDIPMINPLIFQQENGGINDTRPTHIESKSNKEVERPAPKPVAELAEDCFGINDRQKAIINYLKVNNEAKINDLATIFSNRFSLKTLQRDLSRLIIERQVEREGNKRWAIYRLNAK